MAVANARSDPLRVSLKTPNGPAGRKWAGQERRFEMKPSCANVPPADRKIYLQPVNTNEVFRLIQQRDEESW
jgi:hypothetical protein